MAATLIGTTGVFGVDDEETGLLVESLEFTYDADEKNQLSKQGEVKGLVFYNETVSCALKGEVPTTSPFSGKIMGSLSLAAAIPAHHQATITGARNVIMPGLKRSLSREDFEKIDIPSKIFPLIAAS